jgi:APA family basic amino acid/polyamine antiporter
MLARRVPATKTVAGLGLTMATALVVGNMIGSGVFLLPASLGAYGPVSLVAFGLTAIGAMLLALVFARLGRAYPETGGPYVYSRRAFGDFVGFQQAWGYWIAAWVGNAAIAIAFVSYLGEYWHTVRNNNVVAALVALAAIWACTLVNVAGVRQGGMLQVVTTVVKFVPLAAIAVIGVFFVHTHNFGAFNASGDSLYGAITAAAALTLWAFIGLESATVPAEDVRDPERTIPWSTIVGTAVTAIVYVLATFVIFGVLGSAAAAQSGAPFTDAAKIIFGGWGGHVITIAALAATFGALNGWILLQGQIPFAAARDGLFPKPFTQKTRSGAPWFGLVVSSLLVTGLMLTNYNSSLQSQFTFMILLATLTTLVPYAFAAAAQLMLFVTDRERFSGVRLTKDAVIASLAFAYTLWTIAGSGYQVVFRGFMLLMGGIPVFLYLKWRAARDAAVVTLPVTSDVVSAEPVPAVAVATGELVGAQR